MAVLSGSLGRRLADERGTTLPELLVATIIALLVAAGGMVVLQTAVRSQPQVSERAAQLQEGRTLLETVSRELRQGRSIAGPTASSLEIMTYVNSESCAGPGADSATLCRVTYECDEDTKVCTRTEHADAGGDSTTQLVSGILDAAIFSYCAEGQGCGLPAASNPTYVAIELAYPRRDGEEAITLADGVALRNYQDVVPEEEG